MKFYKNYLKIFFFFILICTLPIKNIFANSTESTQDSKDNLELYCTNVLAMDAESSNVIFEKSGYDKVYPASTTKILTAIIALENLKLTDKVEATKSALYSIPSDSSVMGIKVGEIFTVEELLYGLMLPSRK